MRRRQASRSPPSAYRIRRVARRPGGPARLRATITSVRWPTTSRPSRIHDRRASSSRMPVASPMAAASPPAPPAAPPPARPLPARPPVSDPRSAAPGGSSTTRVIPARRASAARRPSRSANGRPMTAPGPFPVRAGRSMTSRSTARPASSDPAIARPSSASTGVSTTSHSGLMPRATTSTGSSAAARSSQATIAPAACASAASRRASVVRPLDRSPRSATPMPRGTPPGPRMASSSAKPVEKMRSGSSPGPGWGCSSGTVASGTVASAPTTSPTPSLPTPRIPPAPWPRRPLEPACSLSGAAAPQRDRRVARAALRFESGAIICPAVSNKCSNESTPSASLEASLEGAKGAGSSPC